MSVFGAGAAKFAESYRAEDSSADPPCVRRHDQTGCQTSLAPRGGGRGTRFWTDRGGCDTRDGNLKSYFHKS